MFENAQIVGSIKPRWALHPAYMHTFGKFCIHLGTFRATIELGTAINDGAAVDERCINYLLDAVANG